MTSATSRALPIRPMGVISTTCPSHCAVENFAREGMSIAPGARALTRIPRAVNSRAIARRWPDSRELVKSSQFPLPLARPPPALREACARAGPRTAS